MNRSRNDSIRNCQARKAIVVKRQRTPSLRFYPGNASRSLKAMILWLFIPVIVFMLLIISILVYQLAAHQIQTNAYVNIRDTVAQTRNYLDNRLTTVFEQLVALENDIDTLSLLKRLGSEHYGSIYPGDYIRVDRNLERIFATNYSVLDSILLYFDEGRLTLSKKDYMSSRLIFDYPQWRSRFRGNRSEYYWRNLHSNDLFAAIDAPQRVVSVFKLYGDQSSRLKGITVFNLRESFFKDILQSAEVSENGYLTLINQDGVMNFESVAPRYRINAEIQKQIWRALEPAGRLSVRNTAGKKMVIIYDTLSVNRWRMAAVFPEDDILNKAAFIKKITLVVTLLLILAAFVLSNLLAKLVSRPLANLTEKVKQVRAGSLDIPFETGLTNEIGILNEGLHGLLSRVRSLLDQVRWEQEQKRLAELETLQAQIKPHFLYNTLDSIKQLCEMGENREAGAMVAALAKFFRISISSGKEIITIADEIEHIRSYLLILKLRYAEDFDYEINIDPAVMGYTIIKLTLQPLVENAVYHGLKQKRGKGLLQVKGYRSGEQLILEVIDNGAGMPEVTLQQLRQALHNPKTGIGFGLVNVHRRLALHYGNGSGLTIESEPGEGTRVKVTLPVVGTGG